LDCELQVDRKRDQVLLYALVQLALDPAAVGIGGQDQPFAGRAQLRGFDAKPFERLAQRFVFSSLQRCRPPIVD
jgi:hypothetical protein